MQAAEEALSNVRDGYGREFLHMLQVFVCVTTLHHLHDEVDSVVTIECCDKLWDEWLDVDAFDYTAFIGILVIIIIIIFICSYCVCADLLMLMLTITKRWSH